MVDPYTDKRHNGEKTTYPLKFPSIFVRDTVVLWNIGKSQVNEKKENA